MSEKVFLTGASGKIGFFILNELASKGYRIITLCRRSNHISCKNIQTVAADILEPESYYSHLDGVNTVLHMAAVTHTNNRSQYYQINMKGTRLLLEACKKSGVERFIFISTRAASEDGGDYGKSKLMAERCVQNSGLRWTILRLAEVYGISSSMGIDSLLKMIERFPLIPIPGEGKYMLSPVYISDVVFSIIKTMESRHADGKIYTIAGPEVFTYKELVDTVLKIKNLKKQKIYIPIWFIKAIAIFFRGKNTITQDQIARLASNKSNDISLAAQELSFNPMRIEDVLSKL